MLIAIDEFSQLFRKIDTVFLSMNHVVTIWAKRNYIFDGID